MGESFPSRGSRTAAEGHGRLVDREIGPIRAQEREFAEGFERLLVTLQAALVVLAIRTTRARPGRTSSPSVESALSGRTLAQLPG